MEKAAAVVVDNGINNIDAKIESTLLTSIHFTNFLFNIDM